MTVFGINGGGSTSQLRIEQGAVHLGTFSGQATNLLSGPSEVVRRTIENLFLQSREVLGIDIKDFDAGCLGSAGVEKNRPQTAKAWQDIFASIFSWPTVQNIYICSDAEILLAGAAQNKPGSLLIAGTGSIALARDRKGKLHRFGGLGHLLGDEGSAYWISTQIFARVLQDHEWGKTSQLGDKVLQYMQKNSAHRYRLISDILPYVYSLKGKAELAKHAELLDAELLKNCVDAREIAGAAAVELCKLFMRMRKCFFHDMLFLDGSVLQKNQYIRSEFTKLCHQNIGPVSIVTVQGQNTATKGACLLARTFLKTHESEKVRSGIDLRSGRC